MKGYYNMPEATAAAIDNEGWYHTGDLASMDERGYCRVEGRLKDMRLMAPLGAHRSLAYFLFRCCLQNNPDTRR
jgi:hypothetical protein